jgi:hypothetical protein
LKKLEIPQNRANGCPMVDQVLEPPTAIDFGHFRVLPLCRVLLADGAAAPTPIRRACHFDLALAGIGKFYLIAR